MAEAVILVPGSFVNSFKEIEMVTVDIIEKIIIKINPLIQVL